MIITLHRKLNSYALYAHLHPVQGRYLVGAGVALAWGLRRGPGSSRAGRGPAPLCQLPRDATGHRNHEKAYRHSAAHPLAGRVEYPMEHRDIENAFIHSLRAGLRPWFILWRDIERLKPGQLMRPAKSAGEALNELFFRDFWRDYRSARAKILSEIGFQDGVNMRRAAIR